MPEIYHGIEIDRSRDQLFDSLGLTRLRESYMREDEDSPQQRFAYVASQFGSNPEHAQRIYEYASKHWLSFATPILSYGRSKRGLPISCFLVNVTDTAEGLVDAWSETAWLSMMGGGVGLGFNIRSADDKSTGVMSHLKTYDASTLAYKQGNTRRGSYATYLDISHPDIVNFLEMRKPTGDQNLRCLNLHHGITISDEFMEIIERCLNDSNASDDWNLVEPHSGRVRETVSAKMLWEKIIELRMHTGEPYIMFKDTVNASIKPWHRDKGLLVTQSNLCLTGDTEITICETAAHLPIKIRLDDFVEQYEFGRFSECLVLTYKNGEPHWSKVTAAAQTAVVNELIEIEDEKGNIIRCTPEHQIYTSNRGWVQAKDLQETDILVNNM